VGSGADNTLIQGNTIINSGVYSDKIGLATRSAIALPGDTRHNLQVLDNTIINPRDYSTAYTHVADLSVTLTMPSNSTGIVIRNNREFTVMPDLDDLCDGEEVTVETKHYHGLVKRVDGVLYQQEMVKANTK